MNESSVLQKIRKVREIKNLRQNYLAQELELSLRA
jgi:DNA-binding XRE family transcriptional regulator